MKYLSRATQANVGILRIVMLWLQANGATSYGDLKSAVRPPTLAPGEDNALRATLDVAADIGLLRADDADGDWSIAPDGQAPETYERADLFRALVRRALLQRAVEDVEAGQDPSDVAMGLTWTCSLDPSRPLAWGWDDGPEQKVRDAGMADVINGKTQWEAFRRWAIALGFGTRCRPRPGLRRLILDPTPAIADCLHDMPSSQTARDFIEALSAQLPTVDTGVLEQALHSSGVPYENRGEATLGPAVGHALERLRHRGLVDLQKTDDTSQRVSYIVAGETRTFDVIVTRDRP